jgi:hypothetical protein
MRFDTRVGVHVGAAALLPSPGSGRPAASGRFCSLCRVYVKKLMGELSLDGVGRLQESPDVAGEVALEAADRFAGALAFASA